MLEEEGGFTSADLSRSFQHHQDIANFGGIEIGCDQLVNGIVVVVPKLDRFVRVGLGDHGLDRNTYFARCER